MRSFHRLFVLMLVLGTAELATTPSRADVYLSFNGSVPGTIADKDGLGTGFTERLPGTGFNLSANDPNMDLSANPGSLMLTSTYANINQTSTSNLGQLEAPGVYLPNVGNANIAVSASFENVNVPGPSDQLLLYIGSSATDVVRAGFHEKNVYLIVENQGSGDQRPFLSSFNAFTPGDDVILTFSRTNGLWSLAWNDLTNPAESGESPGISIPWLDSQQSLYAGVMAEDAGTTTPFVSQIDYFSASVAPEPSTMILCGIGIAGILGLRWRQLRWRQRRLATA